MEAAAILASAEARKLLRLAGRAALRAARQNGWEWQGCATRRRLPRGSAARAGFPGARDLWQVEIAQANPLRLVAPDGTMFLSAWQRFVTDGGSVPDPIARKWAEGFDLSRWGHGCAFVMHDAGYSSARVWIVPPLPDLGKTGEDLPSIGNPQRLARLCVLTRGLADDLLCAGLCAGEGSGWLEAEALAAGVRVGGKKAWAAWRARDASFFSPDFWAPLEF